MFKRFIIKLFGLTDIKSLLVQERKTQQREDEKFWLKKMKDHDLKVRRDYDLRFQSLQAENFMLSQRIESYEKLEDSLNSAKYYVRKRAKENAIISGSVIHKVQELTQNITKISEEINGLDIEARKQLEKIEKKMLKG
jgi:hypothetical protein